LGRALVLGRHKIRLKKINYEVLGSCRGQKAPHNAAA